MDATRYGSIMLRGAGTLRKVRQPTGRVNDAPPVAERLKASKRAVRDRSEAM